MSNDVQDTLTTKLIAGWPQTQPSPARIAEYLAPILERAHNIAAQETSRGWKIGGEGT